MRHTLLFVLPLLVLLIPACGGGSDYAYTDGSVYSYSTPDTVAEGETLAVEVTVVMPDGSYDFSHFNNVVDGESQAILIHAIIRRDRNYDGLYPVVEVKTTEIAVFDGLAPGEWTLIFKNSYWPVQMEDWREIVTVLPSS